MGRWGDEIANDENRLRIRIDLSRYAPSLPTVRGTAGRSFDIWNLVLNIANSFWKFSPGKQ